MHELSQAYQRYFSISVASAFLFHIALASAVLRWSTFQTVGNQLPVRLLPYTDIMNLEMPDDAPESAPFLLPPEEKPTTEEPPQPLSEIFPVPDWMAVDSLMADAGPAPEHEIQEVASITALGGPGNSGRATGGKGDSGMPADGEGDGVRVDAKPRWLKRVEPEYPRIAKITGVEGVVILSVYIDEAGHVTDTKVIKSLGNTGCDEAAITAAQQWRFIPAQRDGRPLAMWFSVPVLFQLDAN